MSIEGINIDFQINNKSNSIKVLVDCKTTNKTGIEIEALTAVSICTLTIYDMCKSVDRGMKIDNISLTHKSGGKSEPLIRNDYSQPSSIDYKVFCSTTKN